MMTKRELYTFTINSVLFLTACGDKQESEQKGGYRIQGDTVYIADSLLLERIKISMSELRPYSEKVIMSGAVHPIPPRCAYVAPLFTGGATKSYVHIGQLIRRGTSLFEISSPDFASAQEEYLQTLSSKELAKKNLKRKEDLIRSGVGSQKELEEAWNVLLTADREFENTPVVLRAYQVGNSVEMILGQPMIVRSPIPGGVIEDNIVIGQCLGDGTEPVATVADLSRVWIAAQVKKKDIRFINEGSSLGIEIPALLDTVIKGNMHHAGEEVDEETRSIQVLPVCDNLNGYLELGMYTTIRFPSVPVGQIQIPEKALLQGEEDSYAFMQVAPLVFVRTSATVETIENGIAVIGEGSRPRDKIVSEGGYYLG